jgi:2-oxoglutarate dehydrogenase E1 component
MPSTPASYCHLLRWHAYHEPRRPLVVFTPKSMLRLKAASSTVDDFTTGEFEPVIRDTELPDASAVRRVVLCSGKVYYDLLAERAKRQDGTVAILRVERLAPLAAAEIVEAVSAYPGAELVWVQEEPANQGAWPFMALNLPEYLGGRPLLRLARAASASPATGSHKAHDDEQRALVESAFVR